MQHVPTFLRDSRRRPENTLSLLFPFLKASGRPYRPPPRTLDRLGAGHDHAVHQAPFALGIVGVGLVHGAAIVPDHDVALAPDMAVLEPRLDSVRDQRVEQ